MAEFTGGHTDRNEYIGWLQQQHPQELAQHLKVVLLLPGGGREWPILVPELEFLLSEAILQQDLIRVRDLEDPVRTVLTEMGLWGAPVENEAGPSNIRQSPTGAYFLGRLVAACVAAERYLVAGPLERLRAEYLTEGTAQRLMELLARYGKVNTRTLRFTLKSAFPTAPYIDGPTLLSCLNRLVKDGLIGQNRSPGGQSTNYLTLLGQQVLMDSPPWLMEMEEGYRSFLRNTPVDQISPAQRRIRQALTKIALEEGGDRAGSHPRPRPDHSFRWLDPEEIPPPELRTLPRLLP